MLLDIIAGARPNFMKIAPLIDSISEARGNGYDITYRLVHTGQHYDHNMSGSFFQQLGIPTPDINLEAGGGSQAEQTAAIMIGYEKLLKRRPADLCVVVGDVTSTMACAITAQKMHVKVAHVEAGIRSGDWQMPEEINRWVTDAVTNYFFTTTEASASNLEHSGIAKERIFWVGNTMIDTLLKNRPRFYPPPVWHKAQLGPGKYIVMTLHRPSNVDEQSQLTRLLEAIVEHSNKLPIVFPVHPRTQKQLEQISLDLSNVHLIPPLSYLEFNFLVEHATAVITDSGGITEETTVLSVPCMTLRDTTERPETVTIGTNELLGTDPGAIGPAMTRLFSGNWKKGKVPEKWDGKTGLRIVQKIIELMDQGVF
ncbi:MAG: UDP-N-acetylglucosamine 2-epimerase (non-hydrolyzing) [Saprospiraceae bacterium]